MKRRNQQPDDIRHASLYCMFDEFDQYTQHDKVAARMAYGISKQGRSANIHLIWATHNPTRSMFLEKATKDQFNLRVALKVASYQNSVAITDQPQRRADQLCGVGDALFLAPGLFQHVQIAYAEAADIEKVTGQQPQWERFPEFDTEQLKGGGKTSRAATFSNEESLVALFAAQNNWGRDKTSRVMREVLGYGMGSERISKRLLPFGRELENLWEQLQEESC